EPFGVEGAVPAGVVPAGQADPYSGQPRAALSTFPTLWVASHHGIRWLRPQAHTATTGRSTACSTPLSSRMTDAPRTIRGPPGISVTRHSLTRPPARPREGARNHRAA